MGERIGVGLIGPRGGWAARGHIPALTALPDFHLAAVCATSQETADEAAAKFGVPLAFDDYRAMAAHPDVGLIVISVRVPYHHEIAMAVLEAGKPVLCEWPLANGLEQAEEMAAHARILGALAFAGLQARSDPAILHLRNLVAEGWIGDVVGVQLTAINSGGLERSPDRLWQGDRSLGANTMTIHAGHNIDTLCFCLGEFEKVAATVSTQVPQWRNSATGEMADVTAPDNIIVNGTLQNGAVVSFHAAVMPYHGSNVRMTVYGREGTLVLEGSHTFNLGPNRLIGARGPAALEPIEPPAELDLAPAGVPQGALNLARAYARIAAVRGGADLPLPTFDDALVRHRLLDAIQQASDEGHTITMREGD